MKQLIDEGWRVAVIWECATRDVVEIEDVIIKLSSWISSGESKFFESSYVAP